MTELTQYRPGQVETFTGTDPTGGRLVAWAEAASAANSLARALAQTAFVPKEMTNVGNATAAILMGDELGLSPLAALRSIYVVHGTPALYARSMVALALSQGHEIWTDETSDAKVVVCGRRKGSDHVERAEWTAARARKAGYTGNKKYDSNPQEMLFSKAAAEIARKVAPDVLAGIPYSVEDLDLEIPATRTVTRESVESKAKVSRAKPEPVEPDLPDVTPEPAEQASPADADGITQPQLKKMGALMREAGLTDRAGALMFVTETIGREVESRNELTKREAGQVIDALEPLVGSPADADPWAATQDAIDARDEQVTA